MIETTRLRATETPEYRFVEELMAEAFPREERRDEADLRAITRDEARFHNLVITDEGAPVGLITCWELGRFCYIEHFAILPTMRNRGYGRRVMELMQGRLNLPIVLEAEPPVEEVARRRIAFYQRLGFTLWQSPYLQPPYRATDDFLPLCLMACGALDEAADFTHVRETIHRVVYGHEATIQH
ncbi:MAG: GNAT family N-acetyltransferase [Bacteroidaceae bacterium]|nr:GNAT family N-acetyltransferase [Bacteroidaceae bacterium]